MSELAQAPKRPIITTPYSFTNPLVLNPTLRSGYCIATALRGPDNIEAPGALALKELTASVLRWFCGMKPDTDMGLYCPVVFDPNFASIRGPNQLAAMRAFWITNPPNRWTFETGLSHYAAHVREAFDALSTGLNVPGAQSYWTWLSDLLNPERTPEVCDVYAYHQS